MFWDTKIVKSGKPRGVLSTNHSFKCSGLKVAFKESCKFDF